MGRSPKRGEGGSPSNIAPFPGKGVWGFGKDAEIERPKALCKDAYKWSNKVGAGRTDNKRPRLHRCRANKAYTALHHGEGVWGFGKDAEIERPKALQDAKPTKRSYRDREFALFFYKSRLFLQNVIYKNRLLCLKKRRKVF